MIKPHILLCYVLGAATWASCEFKPELNDAELSWLNVYTEGDTLIFKSDTGEYDTSIIIKKEVYHPDYNPVEVSKLKPHYGVVWYKNKNLEYHPDGDRLVDLMKKSADEVSLTINYLYSTVLVLNLNNGGIKKYKQGDVYVFDTDHPKADSPRPKQIFWDKKYGIIKYVTHGNVTWQRIGFPDKLR